MTKEDAAYHLNFLPNRQRMLRAMLREPHHTIDGIRAIRKEFSDNERTIARARLALVEMRGQC